MAKFDDEKNKLINDYTENVNKQVQEKTDLLTATRDSNVAAAEEEFENAKQSTDADYVDAINAIDLQKALDIKDIQETRANMGLSRSGISATEQTAAVLAAGNRTADARLQRQTAVDSLTKSLAEYKTQQDTELRSNVLSIQESGQSSIADYAQKVTADANEAHLKMLESLGLDADVLSQSVEQGLSGEEALKVQTDKNNGILDTMFADGVITAEVRDYAKQKGYTPAEAKEYQKLVTEEENEKNRVAQIEEWHNRGVIDRDVYLKYISDKTAPLSEVLLAQETKNTTKKENDAEARKESLKAAYNTLSDEDKQAFGSLYIEALEDGATGEQFLAAVKDTIAVNEKNTTELDTLLEAGTITKDEYDEAVKNGETASAVMQKKEKRKMLDDSFAEFKNYIKEGGTVFSVSSEKELDDIINEHNNMPWYNIFGGDYSKNERKYQHYLNTRDAVGKIVDMEICGTITTVERDSLLFELGIDKTTYSIILARIEKELQEKMNEKNAVPKLTFEEADRRSEYRNKSASSKPTLMPQSPVNPIKPTR